MKVTEHKYYPAPINYTPKTLREIAMRELARREAEMARLNAALDVLRAEHAEYMAVVQAFEAGTDGTTISLSAREIEF